MSYKYRVFTDKVFITDEYKNWAILDIKDSIDPAKIQAKFAIYQEDNQAKKTESSPEVRPSLFIFWVTQRCNLACKYCQAGTSKKSKQNFLEKDWYTKKTIEQCYEFIFATTKEEVITIEFQGGEPLLAFETIKKIVLIGCKLAKRANKKLYFLSTSNFTLLDEEKAAFCQKYHINLCSSMDGFQETHDKNRPFINGQGTYATVRKNRQLYNQYNKNICRNITVITKDFIKKEDELIKFYQDIGVSYIALNKISKLGDAKNEWDNISITNREFLKFWQKLVNKIFKLYKKKVLMIERNLELLLKKLYLSADFFLCWKYPCGMMREVLCFDGLGNIFPCNKALDIPSLKLGNVFTHSYEDLFKSVVGQKILKITSRGFKACKACAYEHFCGICLIDLYNEEKQDFEEKHFSQKTNCGLYKGMFDFMIKKIIKKPNEIANGLAAIDKIL
jgi:radical SAM protein with 4Fe4S-binding SPASM domain